MSQTIIWSAARIIEAARPGHDTDDYLNTVYRLHENDRLALAAPPERGSCLSVPLTNWQAALTRALTILDRVTA